MNSLFRLFYVFIFGKSPPQFENHTWDFVLEVGPVMDLNHTWDFVLEVGSVMDLQRFLKNCFSGHFWWKHVVWGHFCTNQHGLSISMSNTIDILWKSSHELEKTSIFLIDDFLWIFKRLIFSISHNFKRKKNVSAFY